MKTILEETNTVWRKSFSTKFENVVPIGELSENMFDKELENKIKLFIKQNKTILATGWFKNPILKIESKTIIGANKRSTIREKTVYFVVKSTKEEAQKVFNFPEDSRSGENYLD
jgi:hypothetical protein